MHHSSYSSLVCGMSRLTPSFSASRLKIAGLAFRKPCQKYGLVTVMYRDFDMIRARSMRRSSSPLQPYEKL